MHQQLLTHQSWWELQPSLCLQRQDVDVGHCGDQVEDTVMCILVQSWVSHVVLFSVPSSTPPRCEPSRVKASCQWPAGKSCEWPGQSQRGKEINSECWRRPSVQEKQDTPIVPSHPTPLRGQADKVQSFILLFRFCWHGAVQTCTSLYLHLDQTVWVLEDWFCFSLIGYEQKAF